MENLNRDHNNNNKSINDFIRFNSHYTASWFPAISNASTSTHYASMHYETHMTKTKQKTGWKATYLPSP